MNELETLLRSWAPRCPSPRVKQQIFAAAAVLNVARVFREHAGRLPCFAVRWLAPAMAAMMLMAALVNQRNDTALSSPARSGPLVAMMMSNQSAAAYLPASFQPEQNRVTPQTFEWTNGSSSTSSIRSLSVLRER